PLSEPAALDGWRRDLDGRRPVRDRTARRDLGQHGRALARGLGRHHPRRHPPRRTLKMAKPKLTIPSDRLALYDALVAAHPEIERKGATMPYTSLNGHMFSFLSPAGAMALRLP